MTAQLKPFQSRQLDCKRGKLNSYHYFMIIFSRLNSSLLWHFTFLAWTHLLVPAQHLHLRNELWVILGRWDGEALWAAPQRDLLQDHTDWVMHLNVLLPMSAGEFLTPENVNTKVTETWCPCASCVHTHTITFSFFFLPSTWWERDTVQLHCSQKRAVDNAWEAAITSLWYDRLTMSALKWERQTHYAPYQDGLELQNETDKIVRVLKPL